MKSLKQQAKDLVGRNWSKASLTNEKNIGNLERLADKIYTKYGLQKIQDLKTKHIQGVFGDMIKEGLSSSTLAGYATVARDLASAIGKQNIVPRTNEKMGFSRAEDRHKPQIANLSGQDSIKANLYVKSIYLGLAHEMREAFGLRSKESLLSVKTIQRNDRHYLQVRGAKGGRPRELEVRTEYQRDIVKRVHDYIQKTGGQSLVPPDKTLKQGYVQQRNALFAVGARRADNTNAHALRHNYVQERTEDKTDDRQIAQEVGHNRTEILEHYR